MMVTPFALSCAIISNSRPISLGVSVAVGSSRMSTLLARESALPISTCCICATPSSSTVVWGGTARPTSCRTAAVSAWSFLKSTSPPRCGRCSKKMFSATER